MNILLNKLLQVFIIDCSLPTEVYNSIYTVKYLSLYTKKNNSEVVLSLSSSTTAFDNDHVLVGVSVS